MPTALKHASTFSVGPTAHRDPEAQLELISGETTADAEKLQVC